jgi:hypothetical protein
MTPREIIAVQRSERFSPNSVDKDRLILEAVGRELSQLTEGGEVPVVGEEAWVAAPTKADVILSMARTEDALRLEAQLEAAGTTVVNAPEGVANCQRARLNGLMRDHGLPLPPEEGPHGYWLKRGDAAAQSKADVLYCPDRTALEAAKADFRRRGVTSWVVSAHVVGDLVKFYGVAGAMFRTFYPTDDGISKFGDEARNGQAHHYRYNETDLRATAEKLARLTGVTLYGGDAIIEPDGHFCLIDFNDWPSFSRCRDEAARAAAEVIMRMMNEK